MASCLPQLPDEVFVSLNAGDNVRVTGARSWGKAQAELCFQKKKKKKTNNQERKNENKTKPQPKPPKTNPAARCKGRKGRQAVNKLQ